MWVISIVVYGKSAIINLSRENFKRIHTLELIAKSQPNFHLRIQCIITICIFTSWLIWLFVYSIRDLGIRDSDQLNPLAIRHLFGLYSYFYSIRGLNGRGERDQLYPHLDVGYWHIAVSKICSNNPARRFLL